MKYLLDTHVILWSQAEPDRIGKKSQRALLAPTATLLTSPISTLEIARLRSAEKIALGITVHEFITRLCASLRLETVALSHQIAIEAYALPGEFHADPADRVLVASARVEGATLVTADERILGYRHVRTLDPRG